MTTEQRFEETFAVGEAPQLVVSNVRGSITVQSGERDDIHIVAVKRPEARHNPEHTEVRLYREGERIVAKTHHREGKRWLGHKRGGQVCAVDYTVQAPTRCNVEVSQVTGTIHVSGVNGRVDVKAVQGDVELYEIDGRIVVEAADAAIDGDRWSGRARVNTVSGPVQIAAAHLSHVKTHTVSADLSLETTVEELGRYDFSSVSGDVTVLLPAERGVESRGSTLSGRLVCDLPHEFQRRGHGGWRATINSGGPQMRFNSVSGDLEVLAATST